MLDEAGSGWGWRLRTVLCLLLVPLLASCGGKPAVDCGQVLGDLDQCVARAVKKGGPFHWDDCVPYSQPMTISGTYASDFEFNAFYEDPRLEPAKAWRPSVPVVRLDFVQPGHRRTDGKRLATVSRLTFKGRRPLCEVTPEESWLMVDKVLSDEIVWSRPSAFP